MQPTLHEGDEVLVDSSAYRRRAPQPGDLVLVRHPLVLDTKLVKRIEAVDGRTGELELVGDNPDASTDSRSFGALPPSLLLGRITSRLP